MILINFSFSHKPNVTFFEQQNATLSLSFSVITVIILKMPYQHLVAVYYQENNNYQLILTLCDWENLLQFYESCRGVLTVWKYKIYLFFHLHD